MSSQHRRFSVTRTSRALALTAAAASVALLVTGCAATGGGDVNSDYGFATAEQVADSPITIWVDASREPLATAFKDANPDIEVNIETYDGGAGGSGTFQTKVALFDQSGEGWPDWSKSATLVWKVPLPPAPPSYV